MTYLARIGYGDTAGTNALVFTDASIPLWITRDGISLPSPKMKTTLVGANRDGEALSQKNYENRIITIPLHLVRAYNETTNATIRSTVQTLNRMLEDAALFSETGKGTKVRFAYQAESGASLIYFDVIYGEFSPYNKIRKQMFMQGALPDVALVLTCAPFGHGAKVTPVHNNATVRTGFATIDVSSVTGDIPALGFMYVTEDAGSTGYMQELIVGNYPERLGGAIANRLTYVPFVAVGSHSASQADTNSFNATNVIRHTPQAYWEGAAYISVNTNTTENTGLMRLLLRIKDNTGILVPSNLHSYVISGGTLSSGTNYYRVTARNASGETVASQTISATIAYWYKTARITWNAVEGASSGYRVYRKIGTGGTEQYYDVAAGTTYLNDTGGLSWTNGSPPSESTAVAPIAVFRIKFGLNYAWNSWDELEETEEFQVSLGGGKWELIDPGIIFPLAAIPNIYEQHSISNPGWYLNIECKLASAGSGTVDLDSIILVPYHGEYARAFTAKSAEGAKWDWSLTQLTNELMVSYLHRQDIDNISSSIANEGGFYLHPGNNRLFVTALKTSKEHSFLTKFIVQEIGYIPRFKDIA